MTSHSRNPSSSRQIRAAALAAPLFTLFVSTVLAAGTAAVGRTTSREQSGSIAGNVSDATGHAAPGVTVTAVPDAGGPATRAESRADGTYRMDGLAGGVYRVYFDLPAFDLLRRDRVVVTANAVARVDGVLRVATICECVMRVPDRPIREPEGQVLSASGHPLPHARLTISSPWPETAYADSEGRFAVRVPAGDRAELTASSAGFRPATAQVSGSASDPIVFRLTPDRDLEVAETEHLPRGCRCAGDLFTHRSR